MQIVSFLGQPDRQVISVKKQKKEFNYDFAKSDVEIDVHMSG